MAHALEYCEERPKRRRWIWGFALLALIASGVLAVPKYRAFQARHEKRTAIRQQFEAQLVSAKTLIDQKRIDDAAIALIRGEFPTHIEAGLFGQSELDSFDQRAEQVRQQIDTVSAPTLKEQEEQLERVKREQELEEREPTSNVIRNFRRVSAEVCISRNTLANLESRGAAQLKNGNNQQAQGICIQIVALDPAHRFNKGFWANVPQDQ